jgi:hypothetical protein
VNYSIRFRDPVTALAARRVWYGIGTALICQPDPTSSPPLFPTAQMVLGPVGRVLGVLQLLGKAYIMLVNVRLTEDWIDHIIPVAALCEALALM